MDYEVINANSLKVGNNKVLVKIKQGTKEIVYTFNVVFAVPPPAATIIRDFKLLKSFQAPPTSLISVAPPPG